jgi:hypothetical protein
MIATCNTEKGHDIFLVLAAPRLYHSHNCPERKLMFLSRDAKAALLAPCNAANCTAMGIETDIFPARGTFYVATQAKTPYCSKYAYQNCKTLMGGGRVFYVLTS